MRLARANGLGTLGSVMKITSGDGVLRRFLDLTVRRLWLVTIVEILRDALWLTVALLLCIAGIHTAIVPVPISIMWLTVSAVAIWVVTRTIVHRPVVARVAADIDRRFAANALLSTAIECLRTPVGARSPASRVVISQANSAAWKWQQQIQNTVVPRRRIASSVALAPLFIAVFLLMQQGSAVERQDTDETNTPGELSPLVVSASPELPRDSIAELRRELAATSQSTRRTTRDSAGQNLRSMADDDNSDSTEDQIVKQAAPASVADSPARTNPGTDSDSGQAGDAEPNLRASTSTKGQQSDAAATFVIERRGQAVATRDPAGGGFDSKSNMAADREVAALPAAPPEWARDRSNLNAALAAYTSRYVSATGDDDD